MTSPSDVLAGGLRARFLQEARPPRAQTLISLRSLEKIFQPSVRAAFHTSGNATGLPELKVLLNGRICDGVDCLRLEVSDAELRAIGEKPTIPASLSKLEQFAS